MCRAQLPMAPLAVQLHVMEKAFCSARPMWSMPRDAEELPLVDAEDWESQLLGNTHVHIHQMDEAVGCFRSRVAWVLISNSPLQGR